MRFKEERRVVSGVSTYSFSPPLPIGVPTGMANSVLDKHKKFSEALTNETKFSHTYLPTYVPNETAPNETGRGREGSL